MKSSTSPKAIYHLPGGLAPNQYVCRSQSVIKGISKPCPFHPRLLLYPLPHFSLELVRISSGDSIAEEDTSPPLFARTEDPLTTQGTAGTSQHFHQLRASGSEKRPFFPKNDLTSLVYNVAVHCLGEPRGYHKLLEKPLSILLFISWALISSTGEMRNWLEMSLERMRNW